MSNHDEGRYEAPRPQDIERYERHQSNPASYDSRAVALPPQPTGKNRNSSSCPSPSGTNVSITVDPVALITTECVTVTSAMRKHARWANSSVSAILGGGLPTPSGRETNQLSRHSEKSLASQKPSGRPTKLSNGTGVDNDSLASRWGLRGKKGRSMQDNPLMSAFARLRNDLRGCTGKFLNA